jgi:ubiquinone/menaquinone biosynthesis C-methylase UbiE
MMTTLRLSAILFILLCSFACSAQQEQKQEQTKQQTQQQTNDRYIFKNGSYDGIGKWYVGREIAHVMGYQGISWLERVEREKEENTSKLIKNMNIQSTDVIADIGAGSGYHVFKMAPLASKGEVYAVDIQQEMLDAIRKKKRTQGLKNISLVKGSTASVKLPKNSVDKVLMVDVYHEFDFPYEMLLSIKESLKDNGSIYLIEYRGEDDSVPIKALHKMTEAQAVKEMAAAGFKLKENISNLPWQHCMVFVKE